LKQKTFVNNHQVFILTRRLVRVKRGGAGTGARQKKAPPRRGFKRGLPFALV
jgi:hypothetical protein